MWSPRGHSTPDACPGTLRPHRAADGGLVRVRVPGGWLRTGQLAALAAASGDLGDGSLELTSRGNLQVRGLAAGAERELAVRLHAAGLLPSATHERVRNVIASALSGRDGAGRYDIRPLVAELDRGLCADPALAELSGRFLFTVDDGRGDVTGLAGDVGLLVVRPDTVALLLAGVDSGLRVRPSDGPRAALLAARAFLDERTARGSSAWRLAELDEPGEAGIAPDAQARITARVRAAFPQPTEPVRVTLTGPPPRPEVGLIAQLDGDFAGSVLVPLGRLTAAQVTALGAVAARSGDEINITPWRTVVIPDLPRAQADRCVRKLASSGLVTDATSGWVGVTSCAGRPGCAKSLADVRADAGALATAGVPADRSATASAGSTSTAGGRRALPVHWAGCERRCGRPTDRHVEVLATAQGYEVRVDDRLRSRSHTLGETAKAIAAARREQ